jgi:hypothetical protein
MKVFWKIANPAGADLPLLYFRKILHGFHSAKPAVTVVVEEV